MYDRSKVYQQKDRDILINSISAKPTKKQIEKYIFESLKYRSIDHILLNKAIHYNLDKVNNYNSWDEYYTFFHAGLKLKILHFYEHLIRIMD